ANGGEGLRHRAPDVHVGRNSFDQPAGIEEFKALHALAHRQFHRDRLQASGAVGSLADELADRFVDGVGPAFRLSVGAFRGDRQLPEAEERCELDGEEGFPDVGLPDNDAAFHSAVTSSRSASSITINSSRLLRRFLTRRTAWRRMARSMIFRTMRALPAFGSRWLSRRRKIWASRSRAAAERRYCR